MDCYLYTEYVTGRICKVENVMFTKTYSRNTRRGMELQDITMFGVSPENYKSDTQSDVSAYMDI